ncbi:MAG: hypothetical protein GTO03_13165 [Planctomycetales bacterium]|nr:hypothetical protein [Planctomycetales bacterium]
MRYLEADRAAGINGLHRFDQLDSGRRYASPAQNLNASLSQFGRDWNFDAPPIPLSQLPAVAQLTGILRRTGLTFPAAWVIVNATLRVSIILYGRKTRHHWTPNPESIHYNQTYPLVRVELICNMGLRADLTGWPKTYVKSWDPALPEEQIYLQNNDAGPLRTYPTVLPAGRDEIIYQHEGDFVTPPNRVRWYGHLGFLSDPETMDVYPHELQTGLGYSCCYLKRGFNQGKFSTGTAVGRTIPALASHCDAVPDERHLIWKGGIRLAFDTDDQPC